MGRKSIASGRSGLQTPMHEGDLSCTGHVSIGGSLPAEGHFGSNRNGDFIIAFYGAGIASHFAALDGPAEE